MAAKANLRFQYGRHGTKGEWHWHIRAKNGEIIAQGEGYKQERSVLKVFRLLTWYIHEMLVEKKSR